MTLDPVRERHDPRRCALRERILAFLDACASDPEQPREGERDALLAEIARFQCEHVAPFRRLVETRGGRFDAGPEGWPALPADVFRYARVSVFAPGGAERVFRTSGTTSGARGEHPFVDLALYDRAATIAADHAFLAPPAAPLSRADLVFVAFEPERAHDSSLAHMLALFSRMLAARDPESRTRWAFGSGGVDVPALLEASEHAARRARPVVLCATAFALVLVEDALRGRRVPLPEGSRVMFTGGFKGRTRTVDERALRDAISARFGIAPTHVVAEYGMTELSSQLWSRDLVDGRPTEPGTFWAPPWLRVTAVDPATLALLPPGNEGILRFDDVANLDSSVSVQTLDRGLVEPGERLLVKLRGRAADAVERGCSLAIEEALPRTDTSSGRR